MARQHANIPVFIPGEGCRFQCVFCNQSRISGHSVHPGRDEVISIVERHLKTLPVPECKIEIAFFGGNFTGLPHTRQKILLDTAKSYVTSGKVSGIRLSTRPDYITPEILSWLAQYPVKTIELGIQSLDEEVLMQSGRGHTAKESREAARQVKQAGLGLILQMMTGLPGDTDEKSIMTAKEIIRLGADGTRIYPCLVIRDTPLADAFAKGEYKPCTLEESARLSARLIPVFEEAGVSILRAGLHPSDELISGNALLAGPFHPAFREIAETFIWEELLKEKTHNIPHRKGICLEVAPGREARAAGYKGYNRKWLEAAYGVLRIRQNPNLKGRECNLCDC